MRVVGAVCVILGGLVAAVTGPLALDRGSWTAAYLVLVAGVAQVVMGSAGVHGRGTTGSARGWVQFALWNLGNLGVLLGTLGGSTVTVFIGSALLVVSLALAFLVTFRPRGGAHPPMAPRLLLLGYRMLLIVLAVSIPVGMVLSALRNP
ncbi:hypothetical protein GCM10022383_00450 [Microbacterium soli]|uniref:MFS transporter n=2 Tax=Microbacterium soli TaxID=446075 RepID=A0ABP7MKE7_9MICO